MTEKPTIKKREANKNKQKETKNLTETGTTEQDFVFCVNHLFFGRKRAKERFPLFALLVKSDESNSLFCKEQEER